MRSLLGILRDIIQRILFYNFAVTTAAGESDNGIKI
ncbi:hypothetical protein DYBT9275_00035 [Dyadobacter sp. CECT 9275]|uniref:Uncharacterized protein n=1 Tax=Dyadobacter helix TaxID=2822344 RepID=A0A916J8M1_9BACT|nr:hypothetical protein DYBT9275_00035 [Dyadobacter sp. CECT 9275]